MAEMSSKSMMKSKALRAPKCASRPTNSALQSYAVEESNTLRGFVGSQSHAKLGAAENSAREMKSDISLGMASSPRRDQVKFEAAMPQRRDLFIQEAAMPQRRDLVIQEDEALDSFAEKRESLGIKKRKAKKREAAPAQSTSLKELSMPVVEESKQALQPSAATAPSKTFDSLISLQHLNGDWPSQQGLAIFLKDGTTEDSDVRQALEACTLSNDCNSE